MSTQAAPLSLPNVRTVKNSPTLTAGFVATGLVMAVLSIPKDTYEPGALFWPAVFLIAGLLSGAVRDIVINGLERALYAEHLVMVGVVYFVILDLVQGRYEITVAHEAVVQSFIAIGLFGICVPLGAAQRTIRPHKFLLELVQRDYSASILFRAALMCFVMGVFYYVYSADFSLPLIVHGLQAGRFSAPWSRSYVGGWMAFVQHMTYFGYLMPPLTVLLGLKLRNRRDPRLWISCLACLIIFLFLAQSGSRRVVGMCVGAGFFTYFAAYRRNFRWKQMLLLVSSVVATLVLLEMMMTLRNQGWEKIRDSELSTTIRVDDNFLRLAETIEAVPRYFPHAGMKWVVFTLARPIPRVLWPGKPMDSGFVLNDYNFKTGLSLSASTIADWYAAFGWFGIIFAGFLYGVMSRFWSQFLDGDFPFTALGVYCLGVMAMIVSIRGFFELILMSYPLLAWVGIDRLFLSKSQPRTVARQPNFAVGRV